MNGVVRAVAISLLAHALLAAALVAWFECAPAPDVGASLDLSSVELSFAEDEDEFAAVSPALPAAASEPLPRPAAEVPRSEERPLPPDPAAARLPEPEPERPVAPPPQVRPTAAEAPRQARVDAPPRPKRTIRPDYPSGARQRGEQGDVMVEIRVNAEGTVDRVRIVSSSGYPELDEAAMRAVRAARFVPARSGRESVASTARLTLSFKLK